MSIRKGNSVLAGTITSHLDDQLSLVSSNPVKNSTLAAAFDRTINYDNISNCLIEVPQDVKLEINSGSLIIKAGSKIYTPSGANVFIPYVFENDYACSSWGTSSGTVAVAWAGTYYDYVTYDQVYSGTTAPGAQYSFWYDTTNNVVQLFTADPSTPARTESLVFAIIKINNGAVTEIQQVFNGFSYMGECAFVLPGVKGLIPSGRNENGGLVSTLFETDSVKIKNLSLESSILCFLNENGIGGYGVNKYFEDSTRPTNFGQYATWYNTTENILYHTSDSGITWSKRHAIFLGEMLKSGPGYNITEFEPRKPFQAVDASEADYVIHYQRPTNENGYTWYRLYKSGWVEQGGRKSATTNAWTTVYLPIAMENKYYQIIMQPNCPSTNDPLYTTERISTVDYPRDTTRTTSSFAFITHSVQGGSSVENTWEVKGFAA